jgi:hypothetical protein
MRYSLVHTKDLVELQKATEKWDTLEIVYEQAKLETQEERERIKGLEQESGRNLQEYSTGRAEG